jgi:2-oxoisovalerate dehydrogenase E1 component
MYNRAEIIDKNFVRLVRQGNLPFSPHQIRPESIGLSKTEIMDLFESQVMSRHLDLLARTLKNQGLCYYTIGSAGHEGNAVIGKVFPSTDMAFLHYRSGAFMIQRSKQMPGTTPLYDLMLSFVASSDDPIAGGRHKVFGSKPLNIPPQTSTIASHLPKAVGAALSIKRASDLGLKGNLKEDGIILCSFGDASINHSSAVGAFNTAAWISFQKIPLPLVFICEDNGIGISVPTPVNWVQESFSRRTSFHYLQCDGLHLLDTFKIAKEAELLARTRRQPVFLHMKTVRLMGHAGSDVESTYRSSSEIETAELNDPLLHSAKIIIENGMGSPEDLILIYEKIREQVRWVSESALKRPVLETPIEVRSSLTACSERKIAPPLCSETDRSSLFGRDFDKLSQPLHLAKLINIGLHDILLQYKNSLVFGEDVAQKGGVYNVTDGLLKKFGPRRVFNSPLDETSILGTAIGLAHNNFLPICEIQFLAYVHNAEDQIRGEAATLAFFSQGQYTNPMIIRIAGLAYQKGFGGHFHNDNSLAIFRDIPGLIIAVPSNGADAVKMMRTCVKEAYENGRVVIFIEPIALYMTRDLHTEGDKLWAHPYPAQEEMIALSEFNVWGEGRDLLILTYGNGHYYSRQAEDELKTGYGIACKILDFRWIAPVNWKKVAEVAKAYKKILIVEECRKTGSFSEAIVTALVEHLNPMPEIKILAAEDCFIPLGKMAAAGLPKKAEILNSALDLLGIKYKNI